MQQVKWSSLQGALQSCKPLLVDNCCGKIRHQKLWNPCTSSMRRMFSSQNSEHNSPKLLKPLFFTVGVSFTSFTTCAVIQYECARNKSSFRNYYDRFKNHTTRMRKEFNFREQIKQWWDGLEEGRKMAAVLIGVNVLVLGAWRVRSAEPLMQRWFTHSPQNPRSSPLLLSCFSHVDLWHCGVNMYVLWSFAPLIHQIMGSEQLAAFYITGGCISSLASHYFKVASRVSNPSVGASGALLAVLGACCIKRPDAQLSIVFLPFMTFSAQTALTGLIVLDVCGLLFRWSLFDHAAHLGGALFGCWYATYGHKYTWDQRAFLVRKWHEFRKSMDNGK